MGVLAAGRVRLVPAGLARRVVRCVGVLAHRARGARGLRRNTPAACAVGAHICKVRARITVNLIFVTCCHVTIAGKSWALTSPAKRRVQIITWIARFALVSVVHGARGAVFRRTVAAHAFVDGAALKPRASGQMVPIVAGFALVGAVHAAGGAVAVLHAVVAYADVDGAALEPRVPRQMPARVA